jgi:hypothetical protein
MPNLRSDIQKGDADGAARGGDYTPFIETAIGMDAKTNDGIRPLIGDEQGTGVGRSRKGRPFASWPSGSRAMSMLNVPAIA